MNKLEFLTRLRNSLERGGMPVEDINDALTYYEEVFMDAGFGKEEDCRFYGSSRGRSSEYTP